MNYEGEKFLLNLYRELYNKESVKHSGTISDNKYELLSKYLKRLEKTEKILRSERVELIKYLKQRYYDKYVIKKEDIESDRDDTKKKIIDSQKESLDKWIDYLMKEDNAHPMWVKYWVFQGMLQLGKYDQDNKKFTNRSKRTTLPFVDINSEALNNTMNEVIKFQKGYPIDDKKLEKLISNGSFGKIYAYYIAKIISRQNIENTQEGIWKTYMHGEGIKLAQSLEEKNTGWCLTSQTISANYLEYGRIHVYYTKDKNGNYTIPRICIRQEDSKVAEIKGIADSQSNLEDSMIDIVEDKIDKLPNNKKTQKQIEAMKLLISIYNKHNKNEELSSKELRFLYEIDGKIENFGWGKDPRINKILKTRNAKDDLAKIFNCSLAKIATDKEELYNDKILIYYGDIEHESYKNYIVPPIVIGNINLKSCKHTSKYSRLQLLVGSLIASELETAESFKNLETITGNADFKSLKSAKGLEKLKHVGKTLNLKNVKDLEGLNSLEETGTLILSNAKYSKGGNNLKIVRGNLDISKMICLKDFENLELIEGNLICYTSSSTNCLPNLKVYGNNYFYHLINFQSIKNKIRTR